MESALYLGRVERLLPRNEQMIIAHLQPLYQSTSDWMEWEPITDLKAAFPNRGFVTWFDPSEDVLPGSLWVFECAEQPSFNPGNPHHEKYKVFSTPEEAGVVLDLRRDGGEDEVRAWLIEDEGDFYLPFTPSRRFYLWVDEATWIGPIRMVKSALEGYWVVDQESLEEPLACVAPAHRFVQLDLATSCFFLAPGARVGSRIGQADWAPDNLVLKRALKSLQKLDGAHLKALGLTEKAIEHAVNHLGLQDIGSTGGVHLDQQRLARARSLITTLHQRQELAKSFIEDFLQVPSVQEAINEYVDEARQRAEAQIYTERDAILTDARELYAQAEAQKQEAEQILAQAKQEAKEIVSEAERQAKAQQELLVYHMEGLDATLKERLRELMAQPERALADIAIIRAALKLAPPSPSPLLSNGHFTSEAKSFLPWRDETQAQVTVVEEFKAVQRKLREAFKTLGISSRVPKVLHSAFLSGAMPVLAGPGAFEALRAYASCVTGGRYLWLPISPHTLDPGDLFGQVDSASQRFVPHPGGLLDVLLQASHSDALYLVVLDGLNRASVDTYLTPVLACATDAWLGHKSRSLPLAHPGTLSANDPYASAAWLNWPPNVLLAGILTEGVSAIPPAPTFWTATVLLHLDQFWGEDTQDSAGYSDDDAIGVPLSSVPLSSWQKWQNQLGKVNNSQYFELLQTAKAKLSPQAQQICAHFYGAVHMWDGEERAALDAVRTHYLIPQLVSSENEALSRIASLSQDEEREKCEDLIQMVRRAVL